MLTLLVITKTLQAQPAGSKAANTEPLLFMENAGQVADVNGQGMPGVLFYAGRGNAKVYISANALHYQFTKINYPAGFDMVALKKLTDVKQKHDIEKKITRSIHRFSVALQGANVNPVIRRQKESDYTENYYLPNCPQGITGIHGYEKITIENIYNGIDWVIYSNDGLLEYDFIVHAGANPADIQLRIQDAENYSIKSGGQLEITTSLGAITEKPPVTYDEKGNTVASSFIINEKGNIGFNVKADATQTLRIDPTVAWATYFGGAGEDYAYSTITDQAFNIYVAGTTNSSTAIASGGFQNVAGGNFDVYLAKFDAKGKKLWATYYGGVSDDYGTACSIGGDSVVFLSGYSFSTTLASGGYQNSFGGLVDGFLVKFNRNGNRQWATYFGGTDVDLANWCTADSDGNVYLAGNTASNGMSTPGAFQQYYGGGDQDAFLAKYNAAGNRLWSTYYGGSGNDYATSCAAFGNFNVYIAGNTSSTNNIASANGLKTIFTPGGFTDGFIASFNGTGARQWGTYYGGEGEDAVNSVAVTTDNSVYMAGSTTSTTGIAFHGFQNLVSAGGQHDAFLVKLGSGGAREWATYYGGTGDEQGNSCALDYFNNVFLAGSTTSTTGIAFGTQFLTYGGGVDAFWTKFSPTGDRVLGTYYGGKSTDIAYAAAIRYDTIVLCGSTDSKAGIALGGFQNSYGGGSYDAFLAKMKTDVVLPLRFIAFNGALVKQNIELNWQTADEINTSNFIVERNENGGSLWQNIGIVAVNGTPGTNTYRFTDVNVKANSMYYYRLNEVDKDGQPFFSRIVTIKTGSINGINIQSVYPNPVSSVLHYYLSAAAADEVTVSITTTDGKAVSMRKAIVNNNASLSLTSLAAGTYYVTFTNKTNGEKMTKKIVKK